MKSRIVALAFLGCAFMPAARAEGPAVPAVNGKFSLEGGAAGNGDRGAAIGAAEGSIAVPLGHSFGAQLDGLAGTANNLFLGGGAARRRWRPVGGRGHGIGSRGVSARLHRRPQHRAVRRQQLRGERLLSGDRRGALFCGPEKTLIRRQREDDPPAVWYQFKKKLVGMEQELQQMVNDFKSTH
jgi:hypothetical protein